MPSPPCSSGTRIPSRPISASAAQRSLERPVSSSHNARTASGVQCFSSIGRTLSRNIIWSSVNVNCIGSFALSARQTEQSLGDDVALDLVGTGVDRTGKREQESVEPAADVARGRRPR